MKRSASTSHHLPGSYTTRSWGFIQTRYTAKRGVNTYPQVDMGKEHNTFTRQVLLKEKFATLQTPYRRADATALTDSVHCAFVDDSQAEAAPKERTLINTNADLSKPEISVRFYLGDVGPVKGTNHMEDRMSDFHTFGF